MLLLLVACASVYRVPGPLGALGAGEGSARPSSSAAASISAVAPKPTPPASAVKGQRIAEAAAAWIGAKKLSFNGESYRFDCSGFVIASLAKAGIRQSGSSQDLFDAARAQGVLHHRRSPSPGDVAFFDNTYDRNSDGLRNDPLSHVAIVRRIGDDGTIEMVHLGNSGVTPLWMNLREPSVGIDAQGRTRNDILRAAYKKDGPNVQRLTGELWVGFASFWR